MAGPETNPEVEPSAASKTHEDNSLRRLYGLLSELVGSDAKIRFGDLTTPTLDSDDPDRDCFYVGTVVEVGVEESRPWVSMSIITHQIQAISLAKAIPGLRERLNSKYPDAQFDAQQMADGLKEYTAALSEHPDVSRFLDLDLPEEPVKFYIEDMPHLAIV